MNEEDAQREHARCREYVLDKIAKLDTRLSLVESCEEDISELKDDMNAMKKIMYMAMGIIVFLQPLAYILFQRFITK